MHCSCVCRTSKNLPTPSAPAELTFCCTFARVASANASTATSCSTQTFLFSLLLLFIASTYLCATDPGFHEHCSGNMLATKTTG